MNVTDRIHKSIKKHEWKELEQYLSTVKSKDLRILERDMRENVMPSMCNEDFWETYTHLVMYRKQAFLSCAAAASQLASEGKIDFQNNHIRKLSLYLRESYPKSVQSVVNILLPLMVTEKQIDDLFQAFDTGHEARVAALLRHGSPLTYYSLFKTLRHTHDSKDFVKKCCLLILRKEDSLSRNMACILKEYFDLDGVTCPEPIHIEHYELSRIDQNRENFTNVLQGKLPKL